MLYILTPNNGSKSVLSYFLHVFDAKIDQMLKNIKKS